MAHLHRFYVENGLESPTDLVLLPPEEAHHARAVVRLKPGDRVSLFDGRGGCADAEIQSITKKEVQVFVRKIIRKPSPQKRVILAQAWLHKTKAIEEIICKGTELGVSQFWFFRGQRSECVPKQSEKWVRIAVEACKQCGRLWLPGFKTFLSLDSLLTDCVCPVLVACRAEDSASIRDCVSPSTEDVCLIVGPEGDFTEEEKEVLRTQDARFISLGEITFRAETAALVMTTLTMYEMGAYVI